MDKQAGQNQKLQRQRKFLMLIPILVFPIMTFSLWSIGLIGTNDTKFQMSVKTGFNMNIPDAITNQDSNWNKLRFYEQADKDSAKFRSLTKDDPYYQLSNLDHDSSSIMNSMRSSDTELSYNPSPNELKTTDPNEEKVYQKLAELENVLAENNHSPQQFKNRDLKENEQVNNDPPSVNSSDIDRLENMMNSMQENGNESNPEMQQIGSVLDKILEIQHPDRVKDQFKKQSEKNKGQVLPVVMSNAETAITLLQSPVKFNFNDTGKQNANTAPNKFYSLDDFSKDNVVQTAIAASVSQSQLLVEGATVKLRLSGDIYISGIRISQGHFIYGIASLGGERLKIQISSIRFQNNILPVDLSVYDLDGLEGVFVPGAIARDVAKQSGDQAIQSLGIASLDPSIGAQAASAGIQAAKALISRKTKLVRVTIKSGYQVLLRDNSQKNN